MRIRALMLAGSALFGLAAVAGSPALGADYPVLRGSQIEDAPPPPNFNSGGFSWEGFYIGGGAGVSETKFKPGNGIQDLANFAFRNTTLGSEFNIGSLVSNLPERRDSGATFFGLAGYNFMFGDVMLGFEADYTRSGHTYSYDDFIARRMTTSDGTVNGVSLTTTQAAKLQDYASARVRMGWAYGRIMPYATIGGVAGRFDTNTSIVATNFMTQTNPVTGAIYQGQAAGYPLTVGQKKKNVYGYGLTVGGGLDIALADNVFLRAEYLLTRFADVEGTTTTINTARVAAGVKF